MNTRLRVVHAAKFYPPFSGGMETVVRDLCEGTAGEWDVRAVVANDRWRTVRERMGGVDVVRVAALGQVASVPLCPMLPAQLWRQGGDCVVLHEPNPISGSALFLRSSARRLIVWHHSDLLRPWWAPATYGRVQRALYRRAECVIVSSPNLAAASTQVGAARRVAVIPFGIDVARYSRVDPARQARVDEIRRAVSGPRLLFVGRLVYYKGIGVLIDAVSRCPSATLIIAGDGPLDGELRRLAIERRVAERVVFTGRLTDEELVAWYQASDVFVLPSIAKTEAFGVVQVEAMAAGLPVVSTRLATGVPWVNQDGVSGLVVEPNDPAALAAAITRLLGDDEARRSLADGARRRAMAMFTRERMVGTFRTLVETTVTSPARLDACIAELATW